MKTNTRSFKKILLPSDPASNYGIIMCILYSNKETAKILQGQISKAGYSKTAVAIANSLELDTFGGGKENER